ncbi:MAG: hypothetical protein NC043_06940 [Muribaculaceae bacterium]|nr:hypothetical protein [Muribaculaceae bacterium]
MKNLLSALVILLTALAARAQFNDVSVYPPQKEVGISIVSGTDTTYLAPAKYKKIKSSSGMASALTYGAVKLKLKAEYSGTTAGAKVRPGDKFIFRFGTVPPQVMAGYHMFAPNYTIRNFSLCRFNIKKNTRELAMGEFSIWTGNNFGSTEDNGVTFEVTTPEPGVYVATVTSAEPGEYCFVFADNGVGAMQNIFDFSVPEQ